MSKEKGNVIVDIGNSRIKVAVFEENHMVNKWVVESLSDILSLQLPDESYWIFSSVKNDDKEIETLFSSERKFLLNQLLPLPITLDYMTTETLGMDRVASAIAGYQLHPAGCLIIDAGTCLTLDHINNDGVYVGGVISPGLKMRMKSMSHYTQRLPDISDLWGKIPENEWGKSTYGCLVKGAHRGILHELNGFIDEFKKDNPNLAVILTGGDGIYFESKLKAHIFADFDLVLKGLNTILNYNK